MKHLLILLVVLSFSCAKTPPPYSLVAQQSNTNSLLIGLQVVDENVVWVSGTNSTILRTLNSGKKWESFQYSEIDSLQFRDIYAWDADKAVVLSAGEGDQSGIYIFNAQDSSWTKAYSMPYAEGFLDALNFWDKERGIAFGDAVNGKPFLLFTLDGGRNWQEVKRENIPNAGDGEGGFASSGTNIAVRPGGIAMIGTGAGGNARLLITADYGQSWTVRQTPMVTGEAAGITSVRFITDQKGIIVGGDLTIKDKYTENLFITDSRGAVWYPMARPFTKGAFYGSAFVKINEQEVILITGPQGADISYDLGKTWTMVVNKNLWSCDIHSSGNGWLVGQKGAIFKVEL